MGISSMPAQATLAEVMSSKVLQEGHEVTVTQAQQVTVKKKEEDEFLIDAEKDT